MIEPSQTLRYLETACRPRPVARELSCPDCGGDIELRGGLLLCQNFDCFSTFKTLAELAVRADG